MVIFLETSPCHVSKALCKYTEHYTCNTVPSFGLEIFGPLLDQNLKSFKIMKRKEEKRNSQGL